MPIRRPTHTFLYNYWITEVALVNMLNLVFITKELVAKRETLFFRDGIRRIDFVLAYKDNLEDHKLDKRVTFEKNLEEEGLEIEYEDKLVGDQYMYIV